MTAQEVLRKTRDKVGMAGRYPLGLEGLGRLRNEVQQHKARVDEAFALAGLLGKGGGVITGQFEQPLEPLRFLTRTHGVQTCETHARMSIRSEGTWWRAICR
jgi:hypothetical protein